MFEHSNPLNFPWFVSAISDDVVEVGGVEYGIFFDHPTSNKDVYTPEI